MSETTSRGARPWDNRRQAMLLLALLALALILRLLFVLKVAPDLYHGDQPDYLGAAERLLSGEPMAFRNFHLFVRPPGYSLFIALVWLVSGSHTVIAVKLAQALVGVGTCFYIYRAARRISGSLGGFAALIIAAGYPYFIYFTSMAGTETLSTFLVIAGTYHLGTGLAGDRPDMRQVIAGSLIFSLANMVRPNLVLLWPLVGLWLLWRHRSNLRTVAKLGLALAVPMFLLALPWNLHVARQGLGTMFITDGSGIYYYMGHNESARKLNCDTLTAAEENALFAYGPTLAKDPVYLAAKAAAPGAQSAVFWRGALDWDRQHLSAQPCLVTGKLWGFWRPWVNPAGYGRIQVLASSLAFPVLLLGFFGLWLGRRGSARSYVILAGLQILAATLAAVVFSTQVRYRVQTVDMLLIAFSGLPVAWAYNRFRRFQPSVTRGSVSPVP